MQTNMRYLSLFTGIGGFEVAIHRVFPHAKCAGYVEIHAPCRTIYQSHYPHAPCLAHDIGDFVYDPEVHGPIDLVVGGPPCQDLSGMRCNGSFMGLGKNPVPLSQLGLNGPKSRLMYDYVRVMRSVQQHNPAVQFVCENVASMRAIDREKIDALFGVRSIMLDARHITAQSRKRYFWANFSIPPLEENLPSPAFVDVLVPLAEAQNHELSDRAKAYMDRRSGKEQKTRWERNYHNDTKAPKSKCALHCMYKNVPYTALIDRRVEPPLMRRILPIEVERLQGFPDNYTEGVAKCHRMGALGNAVCVPVIEHIMRALKK